MKIDFDHAKDAANLEKHGEPLGGASALDWTLAIAAPDRRRDYGEPRMIGYAPKQGYCVVFVDRGEVRRIISLRKANGREVANYVKASNIFEDSNT